MSDPIIEDRPERIVTVIDTRYRIVYTKGSHCDLCDCYPADGELWCPDDKCRHYDPKEDKMIGGYLKKIKE